MPQLNCLPTLPLHHSLQDNAPGSSLQCYGSFPALGLHRRSKLGQCACAHIYTWSLMTGLKEGPLDAGIGLTQVGYEYMHKYSTRHKNCITQWKTGVFKSCSSACKNRHRDLKLSQNMYITIVDDKKFHFYHSSHVTSCSYMYHFDSEKNYFFGGLQN
jgi:hypothetical protein